MSSLGIYRHYKGSLYKLMAIGRHAETKELMAIYNGPGKENLTRIRSFSMFESYVTYNGKSMKRFTKVYINPFESAPDCF